jgi:CHAT domain-containing protein/Flp pilus assembly protein TadD
MAEKNFHITGKYNFMRAIKLGICLLALLCSTGARGQAMDTIQVKRTVDSLFSCFQAFLDDQNFDSARVVLETSDKIVSESFGIHSVYQSHIYSRKGLLEYESYNLDAAAGWWIEAKNLQEKLLGKQHPEYAETLNNLAALYDELGDYRAAEDYYKEALIIRAQFPGKKHPQYASSLNNLGNLYLTMGDFDLAETYYLEAKEIREATVGEAHPDYATVLSNLSALYKNKGNYNKAEQYALLAKNIWVNHLGVDNMGYARSLNSLAGLYIIIGSFDKAEEYLTEVTRIIGNLAGVQHPNYAMSLNNLALLYNDLEDYTRAENLYLEAKTIIEKSWGRAHPGYAAVLDNLGILYVNRGDYERAMSLCQEAMIIREEVFGTENQDYALSIRNLGSVYVKMQLWDKALPLFKQAVSIMENTLGKSHPDYASSLRDMALVYNYLGEFDQAAPLYLEAAGINRRMVERAANFLSENELDRYVRVSDFYQSEIFSLSIRTRKLNLGIHEAEYNLALFYKGLLLRVAHALSSASLMNSGVGEQIKKLKSFNRLLANEYAKPDSARDSVYIDDLETQSDALEKELARSAPGFAETYRRIEWAEVRDSLQFDEAAVEFVHFQYSDPNYTDSILYAALVLSPQDTIPHFFPLFEEKQLAALLDKTGGDARQSAYLYAAARSGELLDTAPAYGTALYRLIWQPIDSLLRAHQIKTVYFSPSGLLHRIAFAALPLKGKKMLSDQYALRQLGSTRSLVAKSPVPVPQKYTAAVFGGIVYDREAAPPLGDPTEVYDNWLWHFSDRPRSHTVDVFRYLSGALQEARRLEQLFAQYGVRAAVRTGAQATEESLKLLGSDTVKSPDILHVATHGFFFPDPEKSRGERINAEQVFRWNENPLLRSGLAMAGANAAWTGQAVPSHLEDGIATAYEISRLNLSNTKLAVLSACQTGLGDIKGSEGVYGLQRAFKMAGVDYLLVSLWQVPDQETAEFMDAFYSAWLRGKTIHAAFSRAQKKMRRKYREVYRWGAWILVE